MNFVTLSVQRTYLSVAAGLVIYELIKRINILQTLHTKAGTSVHSITAKECLFEFAPEEHTYIQTHCRARTAGLLVNGCPCAHSSR